MQDTAIFAPFLGMMLLTFAVWLTMYARRLAFLSKNKIDYRTINTREKAAGLVPEEISYARTTSRTCSNFRCFFMHCVSICM